MTKTEKPMNPADVGVAEILAGAFGSAPYIVVNLDVSSEDSLAVIGNYATLREARESARIAGGAVMIVHAREAKVVEVQRVETFHETQLFGQVRPRRAAKGE